MSGPDPEWQCGPYHIDALTLDQPPRRCTVQFRTVWGLTSVDHGGYQYHRAHPSHLECDISAAVDMAIANASRTVRTTLSLDDAVGGVVGTGWCLRKWFTGPPAIVRVRVTAVDPVTALRACTAGALPDALLRHCVLPYCWDLIRGWTLPPPADPNGLPQTHPAREVGVATKDNAMGFNLFASLPGPLHTRFSHERLPAGVACSPGRVVTLQTAIDIAVCSQYAYYAEVLRLDPKTGVLTAEQPARATLPVNCRVARDHESDIARKNEVVIGTVTSVELHDGTKLPTTLPAPGELPCDLLLVPNHSHVLVRLRAALPHSLPPRHPLTVCADVRWRISPPAVLYHMAMAPTGADY